jgi:hypothetical protein
MPLLLLISSIQISVPASGPIDHLVGDHSMVSNCQTPLGRRRTGCLPLESTYQTVEARQLLSVSVRPVVLLRAQPRRTVDLAHLLVVAAVANLNLLVGGSGSSSESRGHYKVVSNSRMPNSDLSCCTHVSICDASDLRWYAKLRASSRNRLTILARSL